MTNYRIDRIGTRSHASAPNLTTSTRQNRGKGIKVQFQGVNIGKTAGVVLAGADDQASRCILYGLQTLHLVACDIRNMSTSSIPSSIPPPAPLKLGSDVAADWVRFRSEWQNYEIATDL